MADQTTSLAASIVPPRRAASRATASFRDQLRSSPNPPDSAPSLSSSPRRKGNATIQYGTKGKKRGVKWTSVTIPRGNPETPVRGRIVRESPPRSPATTSGSSSLTPLSSPGSMSSPSSTRPNTMASSSSTSPGKIVSPHPVTPLRKNFKRPWNVSSALTVESPQCSEVFQRSPAKQAREEIWEVSKFRPESLVWVSMNGRGHVVSAEGGIEENASKSGFWWPGQVTSAMRDGPIRVSLFGTISGRSSVEIDVPSSDNIVSIITSRGSIRFNASNFMHAQRPEDPEGSPRKKRKLDLERDWQAAVTRMMEADAAENDGLPNTVSAFTSSGSTNPPRSGVGRKRFKSVGKTKYVAGADEGSETSVELESWSPPPCDPLLQVPGELVLAREKRSKTVYWPAKIEAYIPPATSKAKPKFQLLFMDGSVHEVGRDLFHTSEEPGFLDCKLGEFESLVKETENDDYDAQGDGDPAQDEDLFRQESAEKSPSPPPILPPPPRTAFCELPMRAQLVYAKPVLKLVLDVQYEPARPRHDAFMKGGKARINIAKTATGRGDLSGAEVKELHVCLWRWMQKMLLREDVMHIYDPTKSLDKLDATEFNASEDVHMKYTAASDFSVLPQAPSDDLMDSSSHGGGPPPSSLDTSADSVQHNDGQMICASPLEHDIGAMGVDVLPQIAALSNMNGPAVSASIAPEPEPSPEQRYPAGIHDLSEPEKIEYCSNVLLPEAIAQILLWRSGQRTILEPQSPEEESRLHTVGMENTDQTDWVHSVIRFRNAKLEARAKREGTVVAAPENMGGTKSRPRRI